jgi:hypothetical protein
LHVPSPDDDDDDDGSTHQQQPRGVASWCAHQRWVYHHQDAQVEEVHDDQEEDDSDDDDDDSDDEDYTDSMATEEPSNDQRRPRPRGQEPKLLSLKETNNGNHIGSDDDDTEMEEPSNDPPPEEEDDATIGNASKKDKGARSCSTRGHPSHETSPGHFVRRALRRTLTISKIARTCPCHPPCRSKPGDSVWFERLEDLKVFKSKFGHTRVPRVYENKKLFTWAEHMRSRYRDFRAGPGKFPKYRLDALAEVEFEVTPFGIVGSKQLSIISSPPRHKKTLRVQQAAPRSELAMALISLSTTPS